MSSKCNTFIKENFIRRFPFKTFSGTVIKEIFNERNLKIRNRPEIKPFWKEKSDDVVGVLVGTALPWFMRLSKVDKGV